MRTPLLFVHETDRFLDGRRRVPYGEDKIVSKLHPRPANPCCGAGEPVGFREQFCFLIVHAIAMRI